MKRINTKIYTRNLPLIIQQEEYNLSSVFNFHHRETEQQDDRLKLRRKGTKAEITEYFSLKFISWTRNFDTFSSDSCKQNPYNIKSHAAHEYCHI